MHFLHAYKLHVSGTKSDSEASPPGGAEGETKSPTPMSGNDTKVGATFICQQRRQQAAPAQTHVLLHASDVFGPVWYEHHDIIMTSMK